MAELLYGFDQASINELTTKIFKKTNERYSNKDQTSTAVADALTSAKNYTDEEITKLINAAPSTLDTLGELATAFTDNKAVVDALNAAIVTKASNTDLNALSARLDAHVTDYNTLNSALTTHKNRTDNPHSVTKSQLGLSNVEDKSSADIRGELTSANVINALTYTPANVSDLNAHTSNQSNPHNVTKTQVGLGNCDNTSDLNKPISTAVQNALNLKAPYDEATQLTAGLMSADDKTKLDGISEGSNKYIHPTYTAQANGFYKVTVDSSGHVSSVLAVTKSDITGLGIPAQDTVYTHPTPISTAVTTAGLYKVAISTEGHVTGYSAITKDDITGLGIPGSQPTNVDTVDNLHFSVGTAELTPGTSALTTNYVHFVYE